MSMAVVPCQAFAAQSSVLSCIGVGTTKVTAGLINKNYFIGFGQIFRAVSGGTVSISTTKTYTATVSSNISGSVGITAGEIVNASVSGGYSDSRSSTVSTSTQYSNNIPAGRYGNVHYGNYMNRMNVKNKLSCIHAITKL